MHGLMVCRGFSTARDRADPPFTLGSTTHNREVNDRHDDRLPWWAGIARHAYPDHRCCLDAHRSRLGARCDYRDRRGPAECVRPSGVQRIVFSAQKFPNVRRHFRGALRRGWPRRLVVNRRGADARRDRALRVIPTRDGFDRDEYPAVGRGRGRGLERGRNPRGWKADVRYVPSSENRSHGATLGDRLEPFCNGTRFRYVFR